MVTSEVLNLATVFRVYGLQAIVIPAYADMGGTGSDSVFPRVDTSDRTMDFVMNFGEFFWSMSKEGMREFLSFLGADVPLPHRALKKHWFHLLRNHFFQIFKHSRMWYRVHFDNLLFIGINVTQYDFFYVQEPSQEHCTKFYHVLLAFASDHSGEGRPITNFMDQMWVRDVYNLFRFSDKHGVVSPEDIIGDRIECGDVITIRFMGPVPNLDGPLPDRTDAAAEPVREDDNNDEPLAEHDVDFLDHDNLYNEIPSFTQILVPQDSYI